MLSQPLTKAVQTTEGALVVVSSVAVAVTTAVDPSALPHKYAAIVIAAQNVALLVQRGVIKSVALASGLGVVPQPKPSLSQSHEALITSTAVAAAQEVASLVHKAPESASKPDGDPTPAPATAAAPEGASAPVVPAVAVAAAPVNPLAPVPPQS